MTGKTYQLVASFVRHVAAGHMPGYKGFVFALVECARRTATWAPLLVQTTILCMYLSGAPIRRTTMEQVLGPHHNTLTFSLIHP